MIAIGAGTLADIYEPAERGTKIGLYYSAPVLGIALGPILGGSLTQGFSWRAVFWFLVIFGCLNFFSFLLLFKDTFRMERSTTYQMVLKQRTHERDHMASQSTIVVHTVNTNNSPAQMQTHNDTLEIDVHPLKEVKLSLTDVNPFPPLLLVLRRWNNLAILLPSGEYCALWHRFSTAITPFILHADPRPSFCLQFQHHVHMC